MAIDLNDAEVKKAIKDAADVAVTEATAGLVAKNQELLGKLKKAQKDSTIDPAEYQSVQEELSKANDKIAELTKVNKTALKEAETAKKALEGEAGFVSKLLIDNGLSDALLKAGVKPEMSKAVKAMLAGQVVIKVDGDKRNAMIGDKSLSEAVDEWSKSDEGKHFVAAPDNKGGGANGGGQDKGKVKTMTRVAFEALGANEKMAFTKEGGTLTQ